MRKYINYLLIIFLVISCTSESSSQPQVIDDMSNTSTSTLETTSTTTTIKAEQEIIVDVFGVELLAVSPEMKEQFDELIAFVEKKTGLKFTEYPKFNLVIIYD